MTMTTSPPKTPRLGPHSRVFVRRSLGDHIDGRSREGRFLRHFEKEMVAQLGGSPSTAQALLVRRVARARCRWK